MWLYENTDLRIEGRIIGFDEYMNLVLDDAEELQVKKKTRKALGRILLKGDNITLMMSTGSWTWGRARFTAPAVPSWTFCSMYRWGIA